MRRPRDARRPIAVLLAGLAALAAGCGYGFSHAYRARGGAERVHVRAFQNLSSDPELGAAVTAALREELARRGASAGPDAPVAIEGEVGAGEGLPSSVTGSTFHVVLNARARLVSEGKVIASLAVRRDGDHLGGADPLETEGRRALELRRLAADAARQILEGFEDRDERAPAAQGAAGR
ncbi:conserved hypothetical protein [Anaeromyxobacter sp. K]|uniref:LPS assembly lipoprotein LptE n=1 Tax=Anaeromyxobacter sp. (strain K) TaxID=447217 RepID=UPI00015F8EF2|nr:LPS assembly lipoprotein LptE [Anaeromyxobacter sp. K]ACG74042.1 conserved hypothetical protein [Anaeromyxobacter sp. K]